MSLDLKVEPEIKFESEDVVRVVAKWRIDCLYDIEGYLEVAKKNFTGLYSPIAELCYPLQLLDKHTTDGFIRHSQYIKKLERVTESYGDMCKRITHGLSSLPNSKLSDIARDYYNSLMSFYSLLPITCKMEELGYLSSRQSLFSSRVDEFGKKAIYVANEYFNHTNNNVHTK